MALPKRIAAAAAGIAMLAMPAVSLAQSAPEADLISLLRQVITLQSQLISLLTQRLGEAGGISDLITAASFPEASGSQAFGASSGLFASVAPSCFLYALPPSVPLGATSTLTWSSQGAFAASISPLSGAGLSGSRDVSPAATTIYDALFTGFGGSTRCSATVTVLPSAAVSQTQAATSSAATSSPNGS